MLWYLLLAFLLGYTVANHNAPKEKNDHIRSPPRANTNEALPAPGAQGQTTPASQFSSSAKNTGHDSVPSPTSPTMTVRGRPVKGCGSGDRAKDWVVQCWDDDAPDITPMSPARGSLPSNANAIKNTLVEGTSMDRMLIPQSRPRSPYGSHRANCSPIPGPPSFGPRKGRKPGMLDICEHCARPFRSAATLANHIASMHAHGNPAKRGIATGPSVTCEICQDVLLSNVQLRKHKTDHHSWLMLCTQCLVTFRTGHQALDHHRLTHDAVAVGFDGIAAFLQKRRAHADDTYIPNETSGWGEDTPPSVASMEEAEELSFIENPVKNPSQHSDGGHASRLLVVESTYPSDSYVLCDEGLSPIEIPEVTSSKDCEGDRAETVSVASTTSDQHDTEEDISEDLETTSSSVSIAPNWLDEFKVKGGVNAPNTTCSLCWASFKSPVALQLHTSGPCDPGPPAAQSDSFPPLPTFASEGSFGEKGKALGVEPNLRRNSDEGYASDGSTASLAESVYPPSEVPDGATPDDFQQSARFSSPLVGIMPNAWKARSAARALATSAHISTYYNSKQHGHPANENRGFSSDSRTTRNLDASHALPHQPFAVVDGAPTPIPVQVKSIPATTFPSHQRSPSVPQHILAGFPDDYTDESNLVVQVPCFEFPSSPSKFRAFDDDTPVLSLPEISPRIPTTSTSPTSVSTRVATPIEQNDPPSPSPFVESSGLSPLPRVIPRVQEDKRLQESAAESLIGWRRPRTREQIQTPYYHSNNWMDYHPSNDPSPPPPPNRSSGQKTLADIAKRSKPKQSRPAPVQVNSKKSGKVFKMQPRIDLLEPQFDDGWSSFGGEVSRGGQGGAVVKDDGWGGAGVYTASTDRFGGW